MLSGCLHSTKSFHSCGYQLVHSGNVSIRFANVIGSFWLAPNGRSLAAMELEEQVDHRWPCDCKNNFSCRTCQTIPIDGCII
jgi:hypothetical protein